MIKLTERLNAVASLVRANTALADIGCDHGFLPVYLLERGIIRSAFAADINEGPLASCQRLVDELGFGDKIICVLSDGLQSVNPDEVEDIAICGMGGELIAQIMSKAPWVKNDKYYFIFNPMTHPEILRRWLYANGFEIQTDFIVKEGRHYYSVFDAVYTGECSEVDDAFCFLGKISDYTHKEYFSHLLNYLENKQKGGEDYSAVINKIHKALGDKDADS